MDIRQQIVDDLIEKYNNQLNLNSLDKTFQYFGHSIFSDQSIHSFDINDDVDGGQDKQIDCISIEESQGDGFIYISQVKNTETFSSNAIIQIRNGLNWIFKKKRAEIQTLQNLKFQDRINDCKNLISLIGPSNIQVKVAYVTNGLSKDISQEFKQEVKSLLDEYDNNTFSSFSFELIGATEIVDLMNSQEKKNRKINSEIK